MKPLRLLLALTLTSILCCCTHRKLTSNETGALGAVQGTHVNYEKVGIYKGYVKEPDSSDIKPYLETGNDQNNALGRPVTVRDVQWVLGNTAAVTLGNNIYFKKNFWMADFAKGWPETLPNYVDFALLAHEITHVWQYQNQRLTRYTLAKVIAEHLRYKDPYEYEIKPGKDFIDYRYEQQGAMVQRYVTLLWQGQQETGEFKKLDRLIRAVIPLHKSLTDAGLVRK